MENSKVKDFRKVYADSKMIERIEEKYKTLLAISFVSKKLSKLTEADLRDILVDAADMSEAMFEIYLGKLKAEAFEKIEEIKKSLG